MIRLVTALGRAVRFVKARLDPKAALGLRLSLVLAAGAGAIWVFGELLDAVLDNATLVRLDLAADAIIHRRVTPSGLAFFAAATHIGDPKALAVLAIVGVLVLLVTRHHATCITWVAAFAGAVALERVLKYAVHRTRPARAANVVDAPSFSFPSGHAIGIVVAVCMLLYVFRAFWLSPRWIRATCLGVAGALVLIVGVSRVYLGAHYPSDVLGGYTVAAGWVAVCISASTIVRHRDEEL